MYHFVSFSYLISVTLYKLQNFSFCNWDLADFVDAYNFKVVHS